MKDDCFMLSVIIPVYQAEKFIETAIMSILHQNSSWVEIVLVNDGSTDNSDTICRKYEGQQIQYLCVPNGGAGRARNYGIKMAKGKWIAFLDSDDLVAGRTLTDELYKILDSAFKDSTDIIYGGKIECNMDLSDSPYVTEPEPIESIKNYMPEIEFWSCFYRSDFLKTNEIAFFEYKKQDVESAFRFLTFSKAKKIERRSDLIFCVHRNNPTSNVNTWKYDDVLEVKACIYFLLFDQFEKKDSEPEVASWLITEASYFYKSLIQRLIKIGKTPNSIQQLENVRETRKKLKYHIKKGRLSFRYYWLNVFFDIINKKVVFAVLCKIVSRKERLKENNVVPISIPCDNYELLLKRADDYAESLS